MNNKFHTSVNTVLKSNTTHTKWVLPNRKTLDLTKENSKDDLIRLASSAPNVFKVIDTKVSKTDNKPSK